MSCRTHHDAPSGPSQPPWWKTRSGLVLCGFLLVGGFYLVTEHTAHLFGVLPFLLVLACPLMHLFHHHGHGGQGDGARRPRLDWTVSRATHHDPRRCTRLRAVDAGDPELPCLHHLCLQFQQATDASGLALLQCVQRLHRRPVRRDVRFPADNLSALRLAPAALSRPRSYVA
jgi:hypothetical protein